MKTHSLLVAMGMAALTLSTYAQDDTSHHRALYEAINTAEASLEKRTASCETDDGKFSLTGFLDKGVVKKIIAKQKGGGVEEFYLEEEKPIFVFNVYQPKNDEGKPGVKIEERLYFKDGEIIKWLTTEKPAPVFHAEDYLATAEMLVKNTAAFVTALKKEGGIPKIAAESAEGVFAGIEQGDYAHWNMKMKDGTELSLFILKADDTIEKVIDNPEAYIGKACRVTWKTAMEDIPEAGGKLEISKLLKVEWIAKN